MDETTAATRRGGIGPKGVLAWIAILGLLALVVWLAVERNERTWYLVPDEGRLVVMRGMPLPVGRRTFASSDPGLAQAYAPVVPPPGKTLPPEQTFEERSLLDQALYDVLAGWARDEIASGDPARLERGLAYLARAEKLPGLSWAQREDLASLRAESGYFEAMKLLSRASDELRDAAEKLRRAASSRSTHATDSGALVREVEAAADAAATALRAAGVGAARPSDAAARPPTGAAPQGEGAPWAGGPAPEKPPAPPQDGPR